MSEFIPLTLNKITQSKTYTAAILEAETKRFAIYMEPQVGHFIAIHLGQVIPQRPYTHDLLSSILKGLNGKVLQVVIHDVIDTTFFAQLFVEQKYGEEKQMLEIDARPSDCLILALMYKVPVFCKREMLEKVVPVIE